MSLRLLPLTAVVLLCGKNAAMAQVCTFSMTNIDFGNVSLTGGNFQQTTGTLTANCSGTANQQIRVCANINAGSGGVHASGDPRYMTQGAARLGYNLFKSNGVGQTWGSYTWAPSSRPPAITVNLGGGGSGTTATTVYARIYNGQSTTGTGTYSSSFAGAQSQIDYGYAASFNCSSSLSSRSQSVPFVVRTTNNSSCTVSSTALNFGTQPDLSANRDATNTITVNCSPGTAYTVGLNNGSSGGTGPASRRMQNAAATSFITYGIYRDVSRTQAWGNTPGIDTASATGTGVSQVFTGYGRVPAQSAPLANIHTDTVVVTITY